MVVEKKQPANRAFSYESTAQDTEYDDIKRMGYDIQSRTSSDDSSDSDYEPPNKRSMEEEEDDSDVCSTSELTSIARRLNRRR